MYSFWPRGASPVLFSACYVSVVSCGPVAPTNFLARGYPRTPGVLNSVTQQEHVTTVSSAAEDVSEEKTSDVQTTSRKTSIFDVLSDFAQLPTVLFQNLTAPEVAAFCSHRPEEDFEDFQFPPNRLWLDMLSPSGKEVLQMRLQKRNRLLNIALEDLATPTPVWKHRLNCFRRQGVRFSSNDLANDRVIVGRLIKFLIEAASTVEVLNNARPYSTRLVEVIVAVGLSEARTAYVQRAVYPAGSVLDGFILQQGAGERAIHLPSSRDERPSESIPHCRSPELSSPEERTPRQTFPVLRTLAEGLTSQHELARFMSRRALQWLADRELEHEDRWQELFDAAEEAFLHDPDTAPRPQALARDFDRQILPRLLPRCVSTNVHGAHDPDLSFALASNVVLAVAGALETEAVFANPDVADHVVRTLHRVVRTLWRSPHPLSGPDISMRALSAALDALLRFLDKALLRNLLLDGGLLSAQTRLDVAHFLMDLGQLKTMNWVAGRARALNLLMEWVEVEQEVDVVGGVLEALQVLGLEGTTEETTAGPGRSARSGEIPGPFDAEARRLARIFAAEGRRTRMFFDGDFGAEEASTIGREASTILSTGREASTIGVLDQAILPESEESVEEVLRRTSTTSPLLQQTSAPPAASIVLGLASLLVRDPTVVAFLDEPSMNSDLGELPPVLQDQSSWTARRRRSEAWHGGHEQELLFQSSDFSDTDEEGVFVSPFLDDDIRAQTVDAIRALTPHDDLDAVSKVRAVVVALLRAEVSHHSSPGGPATEVSPEVVRSCCQAIVAVSLLLSPDDRTAPTVPYSVTEALVAALRHPHIGTGPRLDLVDTVETLYSPFPSTSDHSPPPETVYIELVDSLQDVFSKTSHATLALAIVNALVRISLSAPPAAWFGSSARITTAQFIRYRINDSNGAPSLAHALLVPFFWEQFASETTHFDVRLSCLKALANVADRGPMAEPLISGVLKVLSTILRDAGGPADHQVPNDGFRDAALAALVELSSGAGVRHEILVRDFESVMVQMLRQESRLRQGGQPVHITAPHVDMVVDALAYLPQLAENFGKPNIVGGERWALELATNTLRTAVDPQVKCAAIGALGRLAVLEEGDVYPLLLIVEAVGRENPQSSAQTFHGLFHFMSMAQTALAIVPPLLNDACWWAPAVGCGGSFSPLSTAVIDVVLKALGLSETRQIALQALEALSPTVIESVESDKREVVLDTLVSMLDTHDQRFREPGAPVRQFFGTVLGGREVVEVEDVDEDEGTTPRSLSQVEGVEDGWTTPRSLSSEVPADEPLIESRADDHSAPIGAPEEPLNESSDSATGATNGTTVNNFGDGDLDLSGIAREDEEVDVDFLTASEELSAMVALGKVVNRGQAEQVRKVVAFLEEIYGFGLTSENSFFGGDEFRHDEEEQTQEFLVAALETEEERDTKATIRRTGISLLEELRAVEG